MNSKLGPVLVTAVLGVVVGGVGGYVLGDRARAPDVRTITSFEECVGAGYLPTAGDPRTCEVTGHATFSEETQNTTSDYVSLKGVAIELDALAAGASVGSPVTITGRVPGSWSFEGSFTVVLVDWDGLIIAEETAHLTQDWMTEDLVPFTVTLSFDTPTYQNTGALILRRDNPSGLAKNDDAVEIPVVFE